MASRQSKVYFWYHFVFMFFLSFFAWSCKAVVFITPQLWHHYLRSQIKFCLLQVSVYKLALWQHIFLEDMEKWNGRSSLSIVESLLCCAARYGNCWERFRTPRRHVNGYFYTDNKTRLQHSRSWSPQQSHWQLSGFSLECQLLLRRIIRIDPSSLWRKQWKRHLIVAIINALLIAVWSSTSLLIASKSQFDSIKNYCEIQFTHM